MRSYSFFVSHEEHKIRISKILSRYVDLWNVIVLWSRGAQILGRGSTGWLNYVRLSSNIWNRTEQIPGPRCTGGLNCVWRSFNILSRVAQNPGPRSTGQLNCVRRSFNIWSRGKKIRAPGRLGDWIACDFSLLSVDTTAWKLFHVKESGICLWFLNCWKTFVPQV